MIASWSVQMEHLDLDHTVRRLVSASVIRGSCFSCFFFFYFFFIFFFYICIYIYKPHQQLYRKSLS